MIPWKEMYFKPFNPLQPNISMHILHTLIDTFLNILTREEFV